MPLACATASIPEFPLPVKVFRTVPSLGIVSSTSQKRMSYRKLHSWFVFHIWLRHPRACHVSRQRDMTSDT